MEEKERNAYEELMRQQEIKQDKVPFNERLKEDWNVFLVLLMLTFIVLGHIPPSLFEAMFSIGR